MNDIDVVLVTYPSNPFRIQFLQRMWLSLQTCLTASDHALRFLCSSESEPKPGEEWCGDALRSFCASNGIQLKWAEGKASLGHGMNAAMDMATAAVALIHQDDYELTGPLDLSPGARMLEQNPEVSLVRYGYPPQAFGWRLLPYKGGWNRFDPSASWCYGDEPHLQRRDFQTRHGRYTEGNGHASEGCMLHKLIEDDAIILASEKSYYGHFGHISTVPSRRPA